MLRSETSANLERTRRALAGLRRYQEAPRRPPATPMPAIAELRGAALRDYGGASGEGPPLLFVPSLINPPNILDLEGKSLLRWLAVQGRRPLLLDWGWDVEARRDLTVAGHVEEILLPLLNGIGEPPALIGYCLGGTMAVAAAALAPVGSVAAIATPWHFAGFPDEARGRLMSLWQGSAATAETLGALPMEVLQSAFWSLDPARTIAKFEAFADMPDGPQADSFVALEDWANDGPPIPLAAARELFEELVERDAPGAGKWEVGGHKIDPAALGVPLLNIVSTVDRIVPVATATAAGERVELDLGHVGMIVGSRAQQALWQRLDAWLSRPAAS